MLHSYAHEVPKAMSPIQFTQTVLWLDPEQALAVQSHEQLAAAGLKVRCISNLLELKQELSQGQAFALVIRQTSQNLLKDIKNLMAETGIALPVICRVASYDIKAAVQAMRLGAAHAMEDNEWSTHAWRAALDGVHSLLEASAAAVVAQTALAQASHKPQTQNNNVQRSVVYVDPISQHLLALTQRVAQANVTALLEGPTGAGKEILARVLHESSGRTKGPFIALNCAALPEHLIDDMLFGHEKGAFTGAHKEFKGLFEQAQGGTLFLDEIGEMPLHLQAKLLRVLQERQLTRLGSERAIALDVRVVAATNKDLKKAMAQREFREDLYFRISTFKLKVPALCERPGDILPLVASILLRHTPHAETYTLSDEAQQQLLTYSWPGNVRELENVVHRAVVLCANRHIESHHLMFDECRMIDIQFGNHFVSAPIEHEKDICAEEQAFSVDASNLLHAVKTNEQQLILAAIKTTETRIEAARKLGISPRTLRYKMAKLKTVMPDLALAF